jgi:hypothetical protein
LRMFLWSISFRISTSVSSRSFSSWGSPDTRTCREGH